MRVRLRSVLSATVHFFSEEALVQELREAKMQADMDTEAIVLPTALSDEEIVARTVAGERHLFETLMRRHNARVFRAARAITGNDHEAEDVMQDAYVRAY